MLTAYLDADPLLSDFATVVLDEFHERSMHADLGLALARQAWRARDDLRVLVMSATLDPAPVAAFLDRCPVIDVPGTLHPLTIEYAPGQSVGASRSAMSLRPRPGDVLCFLPGAGEIERAAQESAGVGGAPRRGDRRRCTARSTREAQDRALQPSDDGAAIVLATNIAETSLTVPGVTAVIDTGLQKVARYDAERAIDTLVLERVTLDTADQRAGRAARLGPGVARRLWDERDRLRPAREPEIHRVDLAATLLGVLAAGNQPHTFEWFDAPDRDRVDAALALLRRLGALDGVDGHAARPPASPAARCIHASAACCWRAAARSKPPPRARCSRSQALGRLHRPPPVATCCR